MIHDTQNENIFSQFSWNFHLIAFLNYYFFIFFFNANQDINFYIFYFVISLLMFVYSLGRWDMFGISMKESVWKRNKEENGLVNHKLLLYLVLVSINWKEVTRSEIVGDARLAHRLIGILRFGVASTPFARRRAPRDGAWCLLMNYE